MALGISLAVSLCHGDGMMGGIMQTSVPDRVEAESVTVMPLVAGSDQHFYAHDIRTTVARILVGLPFALARLMEATSRRLTAKRTGPRRR
jgi:hypothetical protein